MEARRARNVPTALSARVRRCIAEGGIELPVLDAVALRVHREARSGELDAAGICALLERDAVLVGEVLRLANAGYFGGLPEVTSLRHAVVRLGTRQLSNLALSAACKRLHSASTPPFRTRLQLLWRHASAAALGARVLAVRSGHRALADDAFVAGLLHDIGKLLLLRALETLAERDGVVPEADEIELVLDASHRAEGARLLERWDLPAALAELVRRLDDEPFDRSDRLLCIVRLVDRACAREGISDRPDRSLALKALPEREVLGVSDDARDALLEAIRAGVAEP